MKRRTLLSAALVVFVAGSALGGAAVAGEPAEPWGRLSVDDVAAKLGKPGVYVFDNNNKDTFTAGHVPGAVWVESDAVTAQVLPKDKQATLIFYCANEH